MKQSLIIVSLTLSLAASAQNTYWWGAAVGLGHEQPYTEQDLFDLNTQDANNQIAPLFLSSDGDYMWSDKPFNFTVRKGVVRTSAPMPPKMVGKNLRDAYLAAQARYFPPSGLLPDTLFFTRPQYNTWIELMYNQNQEDILRYAHAVIDNGFPAGVLMIDDNWQRYYGNFNFKAEQFPDAKAMISELHSLGFKVMVWVCPFVSPDSPEYRDLAERGYLLRDRDNNVAILTWWNGQSACYDLTNPKAAEHFTGLLRQAQAEYGIDGFKFDAGDNNCYASVNPLRAHDPMATNVDHTQSWAKIGLQFPLNEYRACWKMGGQPLVQRLGDKDYSWEAVQQLIPQMCVAGLLGYPYTCPDMIGGGQFTSFLYIDSARFDQELIVRSAQVHALMPMMQFSVAPWRVLN
ncbi:MAG: glycoside hydrolase, partial [Paludibacteraceae bacterium]|nr:glycoside hydrolase [Paludibacteraceae bacterium]